MKNQKILAGIVAVLLISIISFNYYSSSNNEDIKLGVITGMSGDYAIVGENFTNGVILAQEQWNGSNPRQQIQIVIEDDEFNSAKGISAYKKLVNIDGVDGLINMTTFTIDAIYLDVVESGIPVAQGFEQGIPALDDNLFQLWPGNVPATAELGKYINEKDFENVALVYEGSSAFFTMAAEGFKRGYDNPVKEFKVDSDPVSIRNTALKISNENFDAVVMIVQPTQGSILVKEIRNKFESDVQLVFDANIQTGYETYRELLGDTNILNGSIIFTTPSEYLNDFTTAFTERFGAEPTVGSETGYNAFKMIARNYEPNNGDWIDNMSEDSFEGADGVINLDENGVRIPRLSIGVIENGELPL